MRIVGRLPKRMSVDVFSTPMPTDHSLHVEQQLTSISLLAPDTGNTLTDQVRKAMMSEMVSSGSQTWCPQSCRIGYAVKTIERVLTNASIENHYARL